MPTPRKPTVLQIAEGDRSKRGARRLREQLESEAHMTPGAPPMPRGLSSSSQRMWRQFVSDLDRDGLLATVDEGALESGFRGRDAAVAADKQIAKLLKLVNSGKAERGDMYDLSILNAASKKGWQQFRSMYQEFGGSPAARSRLKVERPDEELKRIEEALNRPRQRAG